MPDKLDEVHELRNKLHSLEMKFAEYAAARQSYADLFDGDVGSIHENIRNLKAKFAQIFEQNYYLIKDGLATCDELDYVHSLWKVDKEKLAQINDQKPIGYISERGKEGLLTWPDHMRRYEISKINYQEVFPVPLYAAPVAYDTETIKRLRDALTSMTVEFRSFDLQYGSKAYLEATEALSEKEPS